MRDNTSWKLSAQTSGSGPLASSRPAHSPPTPATSAASSRTLTAPSLPATSASATISASPTRAGIFEIEVLVLTEVRGPAAVAQTLYRESSESRTARAKVAEERKQMLEAGGMTEGPPFKTRPPRYQQASRPHPPFQLKSLNSAEALRRTLPAARSRATRSEPTNTQTICSPAMPTFPLNQWYLLCYYRSVIDLEQYIDRKGSQYIRAMVRISRSDHTRTGRSRP